MIFVDLKKNLRETPSNVCVEQFPLIIFYLMSMMSIRRLAIITIFSTSKQNFRSFSYLRMSCGSILCEQSYSRLVYQHSRNYRKSRDNLYDVLGVSSTATSHELKVAYFREAKKNHPDLNPNDKNATAKFQKLSAAYEILSDPKKRAAYDASGSADSAYSNQTYDSASEHHATDTFNQVWSDLDIISEVVDSYVQDMKEEIDYVWQSMKSGDYEPFWNLSKANSTLIFGIITPIVLVVRFPAAIAFVLRMIWLAVPAILVPLMQSGQVPSIAAWMWKNVVNAAKARKQSREVMKKTKR
jgi:hypothetical protein